jgi:hypothetical protein
MRPRFSLRWFLFGIAVLAAVCYVLPVRPTVIADQFVAAVNARDYAAAQSLFRNPITLTAVDFNALIAPGRESTTTAFIYAEVLPRQWRDIGSFQRRLIFRVRFHDDRDGRHLEWTQDTPLVARWSGLDLAGSD